MRKYTAFFMSNTKYWMSKGRHTQVLNNKQAKIQQILNKRYLPFEERLKPINIKLGHLLPNFFTQTLQCYQSQIKNTELPIDHNTPTNSFIKLQMNLKSNTKIISTFTRFNENKLRVGRILQVMDMLAGIVAYRHLKLKIQSSPDLLIVTGGVDQIIVQDNIDNINNLEVYTNINYVGKTSLEIEVNLMQNKLLKLSAFFTMVARKASTHSKLDSSVPQLNFSNQKNLQTCNYRYQRAQRNRKSRIQALNNSLDKKIPTIDQITHLHNIFLNRQKYQNQIKVGGWIEISSTQSSKELLMHLQDRNMHGKIFGGYIMRQSLQLAWFSALKISKGQPIILQHIQNIYFLTPVQVGDGLIIQSKVVYTQGNYMVVKVQAGKLKLNTQIKTKACELYIILSTSDLNITQQQQIKNNNQKQCKLLPKVFPRSYEQGIQYLMGKRIFDGLFQ